MPEAMPEAMPILQAALHSLQCVMDGHGADSESDHHHSLSEDCQMLYGNVP